jgi:DNA-binding transcriptional MocR family regulator
VSTFPADLGPWRTRPGPLAGALAGAVQDAVLEGRIPVGVRLPSEREIARVLQVSRGTVTVARTAPLSADQGGAVLDLRAAVTAAPHQACLAALDRAASRFAATLLDDGAVRGGKGACGTRSRPGTPRPGWPPCPSRC